MKWRSSREYRQWRVSVIRRDSLCQCCNSRRERHAHHIESASYNPELRFDVENGITLCKECHINYHTNFNRSYRVKTTRYNLENFLTLASFFKRKFTAKELTK